MGVLEWHGSVDELVLRRMQQVLRHRGPDDEGLEIFNLRNAARENQLAQIGVAFDRLSIRDLTRTGHQPMWDAQKEVCIAMNGEIYNADELRNELEGVKFVGTSDTEVLLQLYLKKGLEYTLSKVDGMFAICLVDFRKRKVYLIRDRIGEKPLYIYQDRERMLFASEYKAFYCHPCFKAELDTDALSEYLLFRYPAGERTFLKGVWNLTPGSYLEITGEGVRTHFYWQLPSPQTNRNGFEQNKEVLKNLITKSVSRRLVSDRPVGIQLSGGVDSSYLCHVVKNECKKDLATYSIVLDDNKLSEQPYIDIVNARLNLKPQFFHYQSTDFIQSWKQATYYFEAPMNHEGSLALLQLNRMASKQVAVMLCGDGPDECMGGYDRFHKMDGLKRRWHGMAWYLVKSKRLLLGQTHYKSSDELFISFSQFIDNMGIKRLRPAQYRSDIRRAFRNRKRIMRRFKGARGIRRYLNYEMATYMQDILMRTDKVSMASSLEVRVPYLMPELLEFLQTVPENQLVDYQQQMMYGTKMLLKSLCKEVFGEDFTYRWKEGLSIPTESFMFDKSCRDYVETTLLPGIKRRALLNYDYVLELWEASGQRHRISGYNVQALWCALSFELWAQMYLDSSPLEIAKELV